MKKSDFPRFEIFVSLILLVLFGCCCFASSASTRNQTLQADTTEKEKVKVFNEVDSIPVSGDDEADKTLSHYFVVLSEHAEDGYLPLKEISANVNVVGVMPTLR